MEEYCVIRYDLCTRRDLHTYHDKSRSSPRFKHSFNKPMVSFHSIALSLLHYPVVGNRNPSPPLDFLFRIISFLTLARVAKLYYILSPIATL